MSYKINKFLVIILFFGISFVSFGADPPPPDPPPCPTGNPPTFVGSPIEDGVPVIIGLALIYGAFKLQQARRRIKESENKL